MNEALRLFGVRIDAWTVPDLIAAVLGWAAADTKQTVFYANIHVMNTAYGDRALHAELRRATTVYCDGSGVRLGAHLLGRRMPPRLTGADWIHPFCERAVQSGTPLYFLGGADGRAEGAARALVERYPALDIQGTHHGYLDAAESKAVIARINQTKAKVLFVGMGTPTQELWIARHRQAIDAPVVWAVGALFDFLSGAERRGPPWMVDHNLEWFSRLLVNPRRRWRRYLVGNPLFVQRVLRQRLAGTHTNRWPPD